MIHLKLKKSDGTVVFDGTFQTLASATAWLDHAKTEPGWQADNTSEIVDTTVADQAAQVSALNQVVQSQAQADADSTQRKGKLDAVKALKGKIKTQADLVSALEALIDLIN